MGKTFKKENSGSFRGSACVLVFLNESPDARFKLMWFHTLA